MCSTIVFSPGRNVIGISTGVITSCGSCLVATAVTNINIERTGLCKRVGLQMQDHMTDVCPQGYTRIFPLAPFSQRNISPSAVVSVSYQSSGSGVQYGSGPTACNGPYARSRSSS